MSDNNEMAEEYDFSGAERGRFYRPEAQFQIPVYLESDTLVNGLIKADRDVLNQLQ
jgi:hypothetical protein